MEVIKNSSKRKNLFILIGFLAPLRIPFLPLISPLEIISVFYFIQSFFKSNSNNNILKSKTFKSLRILLFLWFGSQTVSDILNQVSITKSIRGIGIPFLVYVTLLFLIDIYEKNHRDERFIQYYFFGHSLSFILFGIGKYLLFNREFESFFKFGGLFYFTMIGLVLISSRLYKEVLVISISIISMILQIRLNFAILLIYIATKFNIFQKKISKKVKDLNIFKVVLSGIINYFLIILLLMNIGPIYKFFTNVFINFSINPSRSLVLEKQKSFFDSRLEYYTYFEQFKDSPFFGKGSWAADEDLKYTLMLNRRNTLIGGDKTDTYLLWRIDEIARLKNSDEQLLPLHSYLLQFVIWGGILCGLFFFYLLNLNITMIFDRNLISISRLYIVHNIISIFFSPLGNNRFNLPIVCFLTVIYFLEKKVKENSK